MADKVQVSNGDTQIPMKFILPTAVSPDSSVMSLLFSGKMDDCAVLKGLVRLQEVQLCRLRLKTCFQKWQQKFLEAQANTPSKSRIKLETSASESKWELALTPGEHDSQQLRYRRHRPRMISQHSDQPTDVQTEASTPGVFDFAHREIERVNKSRNMLDAETQTDLGEGLDTSKLRDFGPEIETLRREMFPEIDEKCDFWEAILTLDRENLPARLTLYEETAQKLTSQFSTDSPHLSLEMPNSILKFERMISKLLVDPNQLPNLKSDLLRTFSQCEQSLISHEETLSTRRKDLETLRLSIAAERQLGKLEEKTMNLGAKPEAEDVRLEYANVVLDRHSLALEQRILELKGEELITQRELAKLVTGDKAETGTNEKSHRMMKVVRNWTQFSIQSQPISVQRQPIAFLILQIHSKLSKSYSNFPSFLVRRRVALKRILRSHRVRLNLKKKVVFYHYYFRSIQCKLFDFQQYSPSVSYLSIGNESSVRSPQGLFMTKSMELISDSNKSAALTRLGVIAKKLVDKDIRRKERLWRRWEVYSLRMEVKYYRALLRSVDTMLQTIKKSEQTLSTETIRSQARLHSKLAQITVLMDRLL